MVRIAVYFALIGMVAWGVWALFADFATRSLEPEVAMAITYIVGVGVAIAYIVVRANPVAFSESGIAFAVAGGLFSGIGSISYYAAIQRGNTAIATTVTALYFVVAAVLSAVVLGDSVNMRDLLGIGCAIGAAVLLAT